jgi:MFS family permease
MSSTESSPKGRLFFMMVLEFFIWGAWLPLIFGYLPSLGFTPGQQSLILNAFPVASIVGMFFSNQWADRKFNPEKFLAFSHLVGGLAILGCGFTKEFSPFFMLMLVHCLLYVPTISITNSIAFANMKDPRRNSASSAWAAPSAGSSPRGRSPSSSSTGPVDAANPPASSTGSAKPCESTYW